MSDTAPPPAIGDPVLPGRRWRIWLAATIYVACAAAFAADMMYDIPWAFGVFYLPMVGTALFYRSRAWVWWLTGASVLMVLLGFIFPTVNLSTLSVVNRMLSVAAIGATATLVALARSMQDRIALETRRAQAADKLKTRVLASLSNALRTPATAIGTATDSLIAAARPDQRSLLEQLHGAAQSLLAAIDNLLDLADATDRELHMEPVDVPAILREAVAEIRHVAAEKHIWLEERSADPGMPQALGDPWAVRRIADNLLGNAIKFTPRGGHVRTSGESSRGEVVLVVDDTGPGMPPEILHRLGEPFLQALTAQPGPGQGLGNGLALCRKLADAMGARLTFTSEEGRGTHARLSLRAM